MSYHTYTALQGWVFVTVGYTCSQGLAKPLSICNVSQASAWAVWAVPCAQQTVAAASIHSHVQQHWHCCRKALQAPLAHSVQQAAGGRPSACQASTRATQILVSAVR